jgi:general secretion pathway protein E
MANEFLDIKTAAGKRQLVLREGEALTIGRHAENKLVLGGDKLVSRFHCVIERSKAGQWVIRDLGASNGTKVNGRTIRAAAVAPGDVVSIGQADFVLVMPDGAAAGTVMPYVGLLAEGQEMPAPVVQQVIHHHHHQSTVQATPAGPPPRNAPAGRGGPPAAKPGAIPLAGGDDELYDYVPQEADEAGGDDDLIPLADEDEGLEELTEADMIPDEPAPLIAPPVEMSGGKVPAPIVQEGLDEYEDKLFGMAELVPNKPFGETDIALLNPRGQVAHPAGRPIGKGGRQPPDVFRLLLLVCMRGRATDIHLEPRESSARVRIRVDGVMVDACDLPPLMGQRLTGVVKVLSEIDLAQRNTVQEGAFSARVPCSREQSDGTTLPAGPGRTPVFTRRVDYRVSFAPSVNGQKLVIRVLDPASAPSRLADLKLPEPVQAQLAEAIELESGMVLVSGPTGSGKTSTLYALVRSIDTQERNVVTIEDPVEIRIEHATQLPVDDAKGNSFPNLLRSVLRQDPDVILVGEIRDAETAKVAMQASITGHLVFSTVHTKDTLGTVYRLLDLGVEPFLLAQGLQVVIAQRLVRQLCPYCRTPQAVTPAQLAKMGPAYEGVQRVFAPAGCGRCLGTGYAGRRALFEVLRMTDALSDAMSNGASPAKLQEAMAGSDFLTLAQAGFRYVAEGAVAFDEVDKAVGR